MQSIDQINIYTAAVGYHRYLCILWRGDSIHPLERINTRLRFTRIIQVRMMVSAISQVLVSTNDLELETSCTSRVCVRCDCVITALKIRKRYLDYTESG